MNIINCVSVHLQHLQEKKCKVAHTEYNTYICIRVEKYKEKLHYFFLPGGLEEAVRFLFRLKALGFVEKQDEQIE